MVPMFFVMTALYFLIQNELPGGPVQEAMARIKGVDGGGASGSKASMSPEEKARIKADLERQYGLDKPVYTRYFIWVSNIFRLDFGESLTTRRPAMETVMERIPISLGFGLPGFFLTYIICIALGVAKAIGDGKTFDVSSSIVLFILYAVPALVFAVILLLVFCTDRVLPGGAVFPLGGAYSDGYEALGTWEKIKDYSSHMFLPVFASMLGSFTMLTLLMKSSMLDVLSSDYVRTARAKGLKESVVVYKHALRNALLPLLVGIGGLLGVFLAGSIIIESVFALPGMGTLLLESLSARDFNVMMAVLVLQSVAIMVGQILSDLAYVLVDPRIDFR